MSHARRKIFKKLGTYNFKNKLGKFEVEEYNNFYLVKKKLQHPSQKGFYDPTAMVVAKQGKVPFFPKKKFGDYYGWFNPFFFYYTGVEGKDHFKEEMRNIEKGYIPLSVPKFWDEALQTEKFGRKAEKVGNVIYEKLHHKKR